MREHNSYPPSDSFAFAVSRLDAVSKPFLFGRAGALKLLLALLPAALLIGLIAPKQSPAESTGSKSAVGPALGQVRDPFEAAADYSEPFFNVKSAIPVDASAYPPRRQSPHDLQPAIYQTNKQTPFGDDPANAPGVSTSPAAPAKDPCAATVAKPLNALGINIAQPAGQLPTDLAGPCWEQINQSSGGAAARCWPMFCYQWDATCFCHQPLYFEEINLERYGYQCGDKCCLGYECCLQPAASAAHFFGTIPVLPYCMTVECPGDCIYTLGHYRPGSCPPWRWHWPPCDIVAADAEAGVLTGLIFAIP